MGIVVSVRRQKAFLRDGEWRSADSSLETDLNEETERWVTETGGPALDSPDPEHEVAKEVMRRLGGRVLLQSRGNPRDAARVWFSRRQYKLSF
jgi:hypothetical protein